eukprot:scaffold72507_cov47-Prasinocladus_malaysianus.AAC.2
MKALAEFLIILAFLSPSAVRALPLAGAGGFAQQYRGWAGFLSEVSSVKLPLPFPEVTVELWVCLPLALALIMKAFSRVFISVLATMCREFPNCHVGRSGLRSSTRTDLSGDCRRPPPDRYLPVS